MTDQERLTAIDATMFTVCFSPMSITCKLCGALVGTKNIHRLWHMTGLHPIASGNDPLIFEWEAEDYRAARTAMEIERAARS